MVKTTVYQSQNEGSGHVGALVQALSVLRGGGVVGYPSETVWGLAALPDSAVGLARLYALKGRDARKPVQLSCLDAAGAQTWLGPGQEDAAALFRFWPGPLTLLAWARADVPEALAPGGVVGLRVPAHPTVQALLAASGGTLVTTSLNPSGQPAASSETEARAYALADLLLAEDPLAKTRTTHDPRQGALGIASTVFDLRTRQVVREGALPLAELLAALT